MKRLLLLCSLIAISSFKETYISAFDDAVHTAYDEYRLLDEYSNAEYLIKVVYGLINRTVYYGICFYNESPNDYKLRLEINNRAYRLKANERSDVQAIALVLNADDIFSLMVYDKNNNRQSLGTLSFSNIKTISEEEFVKLPDSEVGLGNGAKTIKPILINGLTLKPFIIMSIILGIILLICIIIIYIFYKKRKGLFSDTERSKNVFNFKEFIISVEKSLKDRETEEEEYIITEAIQTDDEEGKKESEISKYTPHYSWARDEEERSNFNIKKHLQDLGFITNYRIVDEEEKNKIMLELMRLKDKKIITQDDYLQEISELWKESE
ncbi:MAG: hypothetical protein PHV87_02850 [Bacilli bacterium]|nr:hypothetical protein [Bacilli bacterium]